jgi:hypothetical protein
MVICAYCEKKIEKKSELLAKYIKWWYPGAQFPFSFYHQDCYDNKEELKNLSGWNYIYRDNKYHWTFKAYPLILCLIFLWFRDWTVFAAIIGITAIIYGFIIYRVNKVLKNECK